jgi:D-galactarolactone cycloisomerase
MKLRSIEAVGLQYEVPDERAYGSAAGIHTRRQVTLIRVRTEDGIEGIGEARMSLGLVRASLDVLKPAFIGTDLHDRDVHFTRLMNRVYHFGTQGPLVATYSGLNIAMVDAIGKALKVPACRLIGGMARASVAGYATGGYFTRRPQDYETQLDAIRDKGTPTVKIKIGQGPASDEVRVAAARKHLGDGVQLAVDANANYTVEMALESMRRIAPYRIEWYEEPLKPYDYDGYARLRAAAPMAISAGEAHQMAHDFQRLLGNVDIAQPAVCGCGGMDEARRIADLCRMHSTRVVASAWASGVGLAAAVHFVASLPPYPHPEFEPRPQLVEYDVGENPLREGVLAQPLEFRDGRFNVPQGGGLGIELNEDVIKRYAIQ